MASASQSQSPYDLYATRAYAEKDEIFEHDAGLTKDDQRERRTLYDLLRSALPPLGTVYDVSALKGMKETTPQEVKVNPKLEAVAFCPDFFKKLMERATSMAQSVHIDWDRKDDLLFAAHTIPGVAGSLLPDTTWDEEDVRRYCRYTMINPALLGYHAIVSDSPAIPNEDLVYPYVASGTHYNIIPDDTIIVGLAEEKGKAGLPPIIGTIEYKSPHVHRLACFDDLMVLRKRSPLSVMRFIWPKKESQVNNDRHIQTRMIIQVWAQMCSRQCNYAIHSCGQFTMLFIKDGTTLYMSQKYDRTSRPALAVLGLLLLATGKITDRDSEFKALEPTVQRERKKWSKTITKATADKAVGVYLGYGVVAIC
ncbi:hypothetical protein K466DRAFT_605237 [Polyporus arcularius HHB13444]|uniref:Uncharacterized protein n=1 Tax=Polyporus arcularius HHB13444 TaxID=1314778 RepID=A0A5C3NW51_9APHY|nr:hypothetical protein K466DRAFT_605237 [Polyporus arcularius HHB13444]